MLVKMAADRVRRTLGLRRRLLFCLAAGLLSLALLELSSRALEAIVAALEDEAPPGGFARAANVVPVFARDGSGAGARYVRTEHHWWIPYGQSFAAVKSPRTFRVFCLGGSAAMGWPHHMKASFPALLEIKLRQVLPGYEVEVLNVAANTYGSHRVKVVFDEIVGYQPDLVVVWSGNNEFVERVICDPQALAGPPGLLRHLAAARLVRSAFSGSERVRQVFDVAGYGPRNQSTNRLSHAFGWPLEAHQDTRQLRLVEARFRYNLEAIAGACRERGVNLFLLTAPVNLKDWKPGVSAHRRDLGEDDLARWQQSFREGFLAFEQGRWGAAAAALAESVAVDPEYAEAWFYRGSALLRLGRVAEARRCFEEALRRDAFPVRSLFNPVVREVAARYQVPLIDLVELLERECKDGLIGSEVLIDYVHTSVAANEIIAHHVLLALIERGLLPAPPAVSPDSTRIAIPPEIEEEVLTLRGLFGQFLVMHQYEGLDDVAARMHRAVEGWMPELEPAKQAEMRDLLVRVDDAVAVISRYRRLDRAEKLGLVDQEFAPGEAAAVFAEYVDLIRRTEAHFVSESEFQRLVPRKSYAERSGPSPAGSENEAPAEAP